MSILDPGQVFGPGGRFSGAKKTETGFQLLIHLLRRAISLRMKTRGQTDGDAQQPTEFGPEPGSELGSTGEAM